MIVRFSDSVTGIFYLKTCIGNSHTRTRRRQHSPAEAGSSSSSALPPSTNGPVPRLRVAHTAAASAVVVEQEIVRVVRAAAVDPRDRTAHHNQARPLEPNSKGKLASLIVFKGLQCKKIVTALYLDVLTFFSP